MVETQMEAVLGPLREVAHFDFRPSTSTSPKTTWIWSPTTPLWSLCCLASMTRKCWWGCSTVPMRWPMAPGEKQWMFKRILHAWENLSRVQRSVITLLPWFFGAPLITHAEINPAATPPTHDWARCFWNMSIPGKSSQKSLALTQRLVQAVLHKEKLEQYDKSLSGFKSPMLKGNLLELTKLMTLIWKCWIIFTGWGQIRNTENVFGNVWFSFYSLGFIFSTPKHMDTSTTLLYSLWRQRCCLWGWSTHAGTFQQSSGGMLSSSACSASRLPCWTLPTVIPWVTFDSISAKASEEERVKLNLKFFFSSKIFCVLFNLS